jgi:hypothetical protein
MEKRRLNQSPFDLTVEQLFHLAFRNTRPTDHHRETASLQSSFRVGLDGL